MDDVSTDGANAAKAARWAEGCRRHKPISRLCRLRQAAAAKARCGGRRLGAGGQPSYPLSPHRALQDIRHGRCAPVQIDHTEIDIIVVDELARTPLPGRPWLTLAIDVFSRVVTGLHVDECAITRVGRPARNGIRKSSLTLTANLRLGPASVSSQNAPRREKSRSLMPRCQATSFHDAGHCSVGSRS